jgi:hypothetical protein
MGRGPSDTFALLACPEFKFVNKCKRNKRNTNILSSPVLNLHSTLRYTFVRFLRIWETDIKWITNLFSSLRIFLLESDIFYVSRTKRKKNISYINAQGSVIFARFHLNWNVSASVNEIPSTEFRHKRQEGFERCHAYSREARRRIDIAKLLVILATALETWLKGVHILETEVAMRKKRDCNQCDFLGRYCQRLSETQCLRCRKCIRWTHICSSLCMLYHQDYLIDYG